MTREEASKILTQYIDYDAENPDYYKMEKACKVAIKALEQKPILDKIRAEIEQKKSDILSDTLSDMDCGIITGLEWAIEFIDKYKAEKE